MRVDGLIHERFLDSALSVYLKKELSLSCQDFRQRLWTDFLNLNNLYMTKFRSMLKVNDVNNILRRFHRHSLNKLFASLIQQDH